MPTPSPAPTVEDIAKFSEVTLVPKSEVLSVVSTFDQAMSDHLWALTLDDLDEWDSVRAKGVKGGLKKLGTMEFFEGQNGTETRLDFRNKIRLRYELDPLESETAESEEQVISSLQWF